MLICFKGMKESDKVTFEQIFQSKNFPGHGNGRGKEPGVAWDIDSWLASNYGQHLLYTNCILGF